MSHQLVIKLPDSLMGAIRQHRKDSGITYSEYVRRCVMVVLAEEKRGKRPTIFDPADHEKDLILVEED
jgi:hypothetical protein